MCLSDGDEFTKKYSKLKGSYPECTVCCYAHDSQKFGCCEMSVFMMGLSKISVLRQGPAVRKNRQDSSFNLVCSSVPWSDRSNTLVDIWSLTFLMVYWGKSGGCTWWRQWCFWFHHHLTCLAIFTPTFGIEWLPGNSRYHPLKDWLDGVADCWFGNHLIDVVVDVLFRKGFSVWTPGQRIYLYFFSKTYKNVVWYRIAC